MGVASNSHTRRRYDSVTYDSRGAVAPSSRSTTTPMYGMTPVAGDAPASAEAYRLRSLRSPVTSSSQPRYQEDLRLPPLNLENTSDRRGRTMSSARPPVAGTRGSHLRTNSNVNMPPPFTLEPQPMWSSPAPVVPIPVPSSKSSAATNHSSSAMDARNRSGSDPIRGFDDLNLSPQQRQRQPHPLASGHHRGQSLQVNPAPAIPAHLARSGAAGPGRSSTPGPYAYGSDPRAAVGVMSPPVADPVGRSSTPSPGKKTWWKFGKA